MRRTWVGFLLLWAVGSSCKKETDEIRTYETRQAVVPAGKVVSRKLSAPGESDLVLVTRDGERSLAPAPGPDDMPVALPDGRVAFVSGRTTVASIWTVEPRTGETRQLTNVGLVAGGDRTGFVPTPSEGMRVVGRHLVYDGWAVDYQTGEATRR